MGISNVTPGYLLIEEAILFKSMDNLRVHVITTTITWEITILCIMRSRGGNMLLGHRGSGGHRLLRTQQKVYFGGNSSRRLHLTYKFFDEVQHFDGGFIHSQGVLAQGWLLDEDS